MPITPNHISTMFNRLIAGIILLSTAGYIFGQTSESAPHRHKPQYNPYSPTVHDPVLAKDGDTYYLYCTGIGIDGFSSTDLKKWKRLGPCLPSLPQWISEALPGAKNHLWAPDIIYHDGVWHLYYACSAFGKNTSVIGHATSPTLDPSSTDYKWTDRGMVIQSVPNRDDWNAIDANIIIDETGTPWMDFGSFWNGMKLVKLTPDMSAVAKPEEWYSIASRPGTTGKNDGAIEAPFIYKHGDWYYLFVSWDYCCRGRDSNYKVAVGRSKNVQGPYVDKNGKDMADGGGSVLVEGDGEKWAGVGHCAAYTIDGNDIFVSHAYDKKTGRSQLLVRPITWGDDGWPQVKL